MHNIRSFRSSGTWGHADWCTLVVNALSEQLATSIFRVQEIKKKTKKTPWTLQKRGASAPKMAVTV